MAKDKEEKTYSQSDMESAVKGIAKAMAEEMLPAFAAAMNSTRPAVQDVPLKTNNYGPTCEVCGQLQKACGGVPKIEPDENGNITPSLTNKAYQINHTRMVVFPTRYPEFAGWFRGCGLNGIWYLSNDASQSIWIPKACVGSFQRQIFEYEKNERETHMGKIREHNSGAVHQPNRVHESGSGGWR